MSEYWSDLKGKLVKDQGFSELSDFIGQLKIRGDDQSGRRNADLG